MSDMRPEELLAATEQDAAECRDRIQWARVVSAEVAGEFRSGLRVRVREDGQRVVDVTLTEADAEALVEALSLAGERWEEHAAVADHDARELRAGLLMRATEDALVPRLAAAQADPGVHRVKTSGRWPACVTPVGGGPCERCGGPVGTGRCPGAGPEDRWGPDAPDEDMPAVRARLLDEAGEQAAAWERRTA